MNSASHEEDAREVASIGRVPRHLRSRAGRPSIARPLRLQRPHVHQEIFVEDLRAGRTTWSRGAAMVKELYLNSIDAVQGDSVMIKASESTGPNGDGWVFYESFDLSGTRAYYGRGLGICVNCHRGGTYLLLSEFRP